MRKIVTQTLAHGIVGAVALSALLAWGSRTVELDLIGTPQTTKSERHALYVAAVEASIASQVAALGCDDRKRLSDVVAVRNAAETKAGAIQFDTTVVRRVGFDAAWAQAQRGEVYVVGWCR